MTNWIRCLEFTSLTITTWIFPITFIIAGFFLILYVLPTTNAPVFLIYWGIFIMFFLGISWNTRFGVGGIALMNPFKNYLRHKETKDDRFIAIIGVFFWPWLVIGLIGLFIRLFLVR